MAADCLCNDGWICEQHPVLGWPHGDCAGPGMPCPNCQPEDGRPRMPAGWRSHAAADVALYFVYGRTPSVFFLGNTTSLEEAIRRGCQFLDRFPRITVENVRENRTVWDSNDLGTGRIQ